eukprot:7751076-Alexandrium_andersonii.AAC.1
MSAVLAMAQSMERGCGHAGGQLSGRADALTPVRKVVGLCGIQLKGRADALTLVHKVAGLRGAG